MSLSKASICKVEPQPSTSAAAVKQMELNGLEKEKTRIQILAAKICSGCRIGWLCCDCNLGCLNCKQRRRYCFCQVAQSTVPGIRVRLPCLICLDPRQSCFCHLKWRCKWCVVSLQKCKRGGCVKLLPDRRSTEAAAYEEIFKKEDEFDDSEEIGIRKQVLPVNVAWNKISNGSSWSIGSSSSGMSSADSYSSVEEKSDV